MRFGSFVFPVSHNPENDGVVIDHTLEEIKLAEDIGLDSVWLTEHHFDGAAAHADPLVLAGAIFAYSQLAMNSNLREIRKLEAVNSELTQQIVRREAMINRLSRCRCAWTSLVTSASRSCSASPPVPAMLRRMQEERPCGWRTPRSARPKSREFRPPIRI